MIRSVEFADLIVRFLGVKFGRFTKFFVSTFLYRAMRSVEFADLIVRFLSVKFGEIYQIFRLNIPVRGDSFS